MAERIALVTGGAAGIGYACAEALKDDGCRVVLADIDEGVMAAAERLGATGYICDMGDAEAILALFDRIEAEVGPVSVLVNNAGIARGGDFLTHDLETFRKVIDVNLIGTFVATQRAARTMAAEGSRAPSSTCPRSTRRWRSRRFPPIAPRKAASCS
jgi:glucose 1-dehydrogenase